MSDVTFLADSVVTRPLTPTDATAVFELTYAAEMADKGYPMVELDDILGDWARPSYDLGGQSIGFFEHGDLVAYGEVHRKRLEAYVHPAHRGRGLGTTLYRWGLAKAKELGYDRVGQTVPVTNVGAVALFKAHGGTLLYSSWILELPEGAAIAPQDLPAGHRLRAFEPERDTYDVYRTFEDAFNEWPDRQPSTFEDWQAFAFARSDFQPWQINTVVEDVDGVERILGACRISVSADEGWVDQIAVHREARGRGLGRALLVSAFTEARSRGATRFRLNTDSRTGALGLYEHVGMAVVETYEHYVVDLG
jgi:ribosomal protein S18 acetylase RimI-like enzyme